MSKNFDLMSSLLDIRPMERIELSGPQVGGTMSTIPDSSSDSEESPDEEDVDYATVIQERDAEEALKFAEIQITKPLDAINDVDDFTTVTYTGDNASYFNGVGCQVYKNYHFDYNSQQDLPITAKKDAVRITIPDTIT